MPSSRPDNFIEVGWPRGGLNENWSFDDQPGNSTEEVMNCRNLDPETGRDRGGSRPGRTKQNSIKVHVDYRVSDLVSVTYQQKILDYTFDPSSAWDQDTPSDGDCWWGETDSEGNVYALDGVDGIVKYSADGTEIYRFELPVAPGAEVRTLDVDEGTNVYCGVSGARGIPLGVAGSQEPGNGLILGSKDDAKLWKLQHGFRNNDEDVEPELEVAWELDSTQLAGLIGFVRVKGGKLYTIQHDNDAWKSYLVVYDAIHSANPIETLREFIPYPASSLDVDLNGRVAISVEQFTRRGENPDSPQSIAPLEAWNIDDNIDDSIQSGENKHQRWSSYRVDPQYLVTDGGLTPENGDRVLEWRDASGNGRTLFYSTTAGNPPIYKEKGLNGKPCILFDGTTNVLRSLESPTENAEFRDNQRGIFPTYTDPNDAERAAQYAVVALVRPEATDDGTTAVSNQFPIWNHPTSYSTLTDQSALLFNRSPSDTLSATGNTSTGTVSWYHRATAPSPRGPGEGGDGSASFLMPAGYDDLLGGVSNPNALLVSCIACNGVDAGTGADKTRSLLRINGLPIDRFEQEADTLTSTGEQYLGGSDSADFSNFNQFRGEIYRMEVLDRRDLDSAGADSVCSHPKAPDATEGDRVCTVTITDEGSGGSPASSSGALTFSGGSPSVPATGTWSSANGKLTSITVTSGGSGYTSQPTVGFAGVGVPTNAAAQAGMGYSAGSNPDPSTLEKIEAEIAWEFGIAYVLPFGSNASGGTFQTYTVPRVNSSGTAGSYSWQVPGHPYYDPINGAFFLDGQGPPVNDETQGIFRYIHKGELLILLDGSGKILDTLSGEQQNGIGLGVRWNSDGTALYTAGNSLSLKAQGFAPPGDRASVRKILVGKDGQLDVAGGWAADTALQMSGQRVGLRVDAAGNVYVPCNAPLDTADAYTLRIYRGSDGGTIHTFSAGVGAANQGSYAVALPRVIEKADLVPFTPDYEGDLADEVVEKVYIFSRDLNYDGTDTAGSVRRYNLVTSEPNGDPSRVRVDLAVGNGNIRKISVDPLVTVPGGAGALYQANGGVEYVHSTAAFQRAYFTDGTNDVVYDPKTDAASAWVATRGELPARCRIIELWRGRLVRTGQEEFPGAVNMSRVGEPLDWDKSPPVPTVVQACDFSTTEVGDVPDKVTGFCPYSDDLAIIFCDSSIWALRGDPMLNGRLDLISDITGGAFGRAWAKDEEGRIWFFGTTGGLYALPVSGLSVGKPQRVSLNRIERRLQQIDFSQYYIRMAYDDVSEGLWVMPLPYDTRDEVVETYFYSLKTDSFWLDTITNDTRQVTSLLTVNGDAPDDRQVYMGHRDGFVRYIDKDNPLDDDEPVASSVTLGPFQAPVDAHEARLTKLRMVLASGQSGVNWTLYSNDTPDDKGSPKRSGTFVKGNNPIASARTRGSYFWIQLDQQGPGRFSFERGALEYELAGRRRVRQ